MGSNQDRTEKPIHRVTVAPFAIGRFPVTVAEWRRCVADKACVYEPKGDDRTPVHNLSWDDAEQYVAWLSKVAGHPYRLPTEAECEYAARAGTTTRYWWGDSFSPTRADCRTCGSPATTGPPPVGSFEPNPFGLYDVTGSVAQWIADCWHKDYRGAPKDGSAWEAPRCRERVLRGGSWMSEPENLRITTRESYDASVRYPGHGLRVVRSIP